jgi:hypothetical protein
MPSVPIIQSGSLPRPGQTSGETSGNLSTSESSTGVSSVPSRSVMSGVVSTGNEIGGFGSESGVVRVSVLVEESTGGRVVRTLIQGVRSG